MEKGRKKKKQVQIHALEKEILHLLWHGALSLSSIQVAIGKACKRSLQSLEKKQAVVVQYKKTGPIYALSPFGKILYLYFFPFPVVLDQLSYTNDPVAKWWNRKNSTVLVLPETAAKETGFSLSSIQNRIIPFHYLLLGRRLYVLKQADAKDISSDFPTITSRELAGLLPKIPLKIRTELQKLGNKRKYETFFNWCEVLQYCLREGRYFPPGSKKPVAWAPEKWDKWDGFKNF